MRRSDQSEVIRAIMLEGSLHFLHGRWNTHLVGRADIRVRQCVDPTSLVDAVRVAV